MEAILPYNTQDREHFCNCAIEIGFDEFVALKFVYTMQDSDLDMFQLMGGERISLLLYGWEVCHMHLQLPGRPDQLSANVQTVLKRLTQHSLDLWFSKEWDKCKLQFKKMLLFCLKRAQDTLKKIPELSQLNWDYLLQLGLSPRNLPYLRKFEEAVPNQNETLQQSSEHVEEAATAEDIDYLKKEGLIIVLLRLIKMFDAGCMEGVKRLSMRIIAGWNAVYEETNKRQNVAFSNVSEEHKQALILICHIYLMSIYEMDDVTGYVIDNMVNNIRFYYRSIQEKAASDDCSVEHLEYTPARHIAMTCVNLRISSNEFFEAFIYDTYDESFVSLFGVISQAYMSYLLGNLVMEMNNMNEQNFKENLDYYKRTINLYVDERERSEMFMLCEMRKKDLQRNSHSLTAVVENMTNFKTKMCKGNRMSNIANYENSNDEEKDVKFDIYGEENDRRMDPIFQNIPNYENILGYVYNVLAQRTYKGWHFAKLVLLLKIIGLELNVIETWRYHPGLTTDFMLNLEMKLSHHFEDLAKIFQEYPFMEQEFWLTAFYLNPCKKYYEKTIHCGVRSNRRRLNADGSEVTVKVDPDGRPEKTPTNPVNAKFGLLSSTIDVHEIVKIANHETPECDYDPLYKALHSFRLSESVIKDLLTVIFLPRNKSFAWAVKWPELRHRCKNLLKNADHKRRLVELNMAEAGDHLKFLKIDYEKYKHRPQLDYGSIEEGYEGMNNYENYDDDSDDDIEAEESEDFEADSDLDAPKKNEPKKTDHSELFDSYFMSTRRTRARAAAVIATALGKDKSVSQEKDEKTEANTNEPQAQNTENKTEVSENVNTPSTSRAATSVAIDKRDLKEWLQECTTFNNDTNGFKPFPDIWNFESEELQKVENDSMAHLETRNLLQKFANLKSLKEYNNKYEIKDHGDKDTTKELTMRSHKSLDENDFSDSDKSNTSTTAMKDSEEVNEFQRDEEKDESFENPAIEKEMTDRMAKHTPSNNENIVSTKPLLKNRATSIAANAANLPIIRNLSSDSTAFGHDNSNSSTDNEQKTPGTNSYNDELKKQCLERQLHVSLTRLTASDLLNLRQPSVCLKRINVEQYIEENIKRRCSQSKVFGDSDENSKSSNGSPYSESTVQPSQTLRELLLKRHQYSSESSTDTDEYKFKRRVVHSRSRGARMYAGSSSSSSSSRGSTRGRRKSMTVTPRSASGLKLRISSATRGGHRTSCTSSSSSNKAKGKILPVIDYIQISSSSSSEEFEPETSSYLDVVSEDPEVDPLYEEEIMPI